MLKIRLRRMGKRHRPFYRVVVSDSRLVPAAPAVDEIGHYDPMAKPPRVRIDLERVEHWAGQGAQLSPAVKKLVKGVRTGRHEKAEAEAPKKAAAPKPAAEEAAPTLSELADEPKSEAVAETAGAQDEEGEATPPPESPEAEVKAAAAEASEEPPAEAPAESEEETEPETKKGAAKEDAADQ